MELTWKHIKSNPPTEREAVIVRNSKKQTTVAYLCDGEFYSLQYDPHLGVLRKHCLSDSPVYWTEITVPGL